MSNTLNKMENFKTKKDEANTLPNNETEVSISQYEISKFSENNYSVQFGKNQISKYYFNKSNIVEKQKQSNLKSQKIRFVLQNMSFMETEKTKEQKISKETDLKSYKTECNLNSLTNVYKSESNKIRLLMTSKKYDQALIMSYNQQDSNIEINNEKLEYKQVEFKSNSSQNESIKNDQKSKSYLGKKIQN